MSSPFIEKWNDREVRALVARQWFELDEAGVPDLYRAAQEKRASVLAEIVSRDRFLANDAFLEASSRRWVGQRGDTLLPQARNFGYRDEEPTEVDVQLTQVSTFGGYELSDARIDVGQLIGDEAKLYFDFTREHLEMFRRQAEELHAVGLALPALAI